MWQDGYDSEETYCIGGQAGAMHTVDSSGPVKSHRRAASSSKIINHVI